MRQFEGIIARHDADPAAWEAHVQGGDITPWRLVHAQTARDYYARIEAGDSKADAIRFCMARHGLKKQAIRQIVRRMS